MEIDYQTRLKNLHTIIIDEPLIKSKDLSYILQKEKELIDIAKENNIEDPVIVAIGGGPYNQSVYNAVCSREEAQKLRKEAIENNYSLSPSYLMLGLDWFNRKKYSFN